ncbi:MAG: PD40 domain-containing protein [Bacteroidales bacterium]|nr:PD40 domain-containing protein [Bacteroidales bacterium]
MKRSLTSIAIALILTACAGKGAFPDIGSAAPILPDYTDITLPVNIAPLNFQLEGADALRLEIEGSRQYRFKAGGAKMRFPLKKWKEMLREETGNTLRLTLTARFGNESVRYAPFTWTVSSDSIDRYLSYRLIEPAYEVWNVLSIEERDLESFKTRLLADNTTVESTCINCHTANRGNGVHTSFMHVRGAKGGTLYNRDGQLRKLNTATDSTAGAAVYGEITTDGRYGIFTTADIRPILHSGRFDKLEVFDASSDLILLDFEQGTVTDSPLAKGPEFQETFPCWSADGKTVYFCRAVSRPQPDSTFGMHYNLCSIAFDPTTGRLGDTLTLVVDATALGKSVSFPKCSPDGRYILMTVSDYGTFPIWHSETDLWLYEIATGTLSPLEAVNGKYSDSYHCWSSSGRWICWASKRDDRLYGKPYFSHVGDDGTFSKPFVLPQRDPGRYLVTLKSYNIPELYRLPESYDAAYVSRFYGDMEAEKMTYTK